MAHNDNRSHLFRGIAENLHIKGNTAGTSNELSLSVLDERSKKADGKSSTTPRLSRLNKVSVFSVENGTSRKEKKSEKKAEKRAEKNAGNAPTGADVAGYALDLSTKGRAARARKRALENPEAEIRRRKSARRARRVIGTVVGVAASIAVIAYAGYHLWSAYQQNMENLTVLGQAMQELETADEVVLAVDELATDGIGDTSDEDLDALIAQMDDARIHINAAAAFGETAYESMEQSADREAALKAQESAAARTELLDDALIIIQAESQARTASTAMQQCWDSLVSADALLKEAAAMVTETTNENVKASEEKTIQARDTLNEAAASLASAQEAYPPADLSVFESYIAKRLEAIEYALASNEAIYIQDKATADEQNALYNEADAEAVEIAQKLPKDPTQPIEDALEADTQETRDSYFDTREAAAQSDAYIRDYLGESQ